MSSGSNHKKIRLALCQSPELTLNELFLRQKYTDLVIHVGSKIYHAHASVLCTAIPFFEAMISSELRESRERTVYLLHPINESNFEWLLAYSYGQSNVDLTVDNVRDILAAADFLQVEPVIRGCCSLLSQLISTETVLQIAQWIGHYRVGPLRDHVKIFINQRFNSIIKSTSFLEIDQDMLCDIINRDNIALSQEIDLVEALLVWVKRDSEERITALPSLLKQIRWCSVELSDVRDLINRYTEIISTDQQTCDTMRDVIAFLCNLSSSLSVPEVWLRPRLKVSPFRGSLWLGVFNGLLELASYEPITQCWHEFSALEAKPISSSLESVEFDPKEPSIKLLSNGIVIDVLGWSWQTIGIDGFHLVQDSAMQIFQGSIYITGGYVSGKSCSNVNVFDLSSRTCRPVSSMLQGRMNHALIECNGSLYAIGGSQHGTRYQTLNSVEKFDPSIGRWELVSPMLTHRSKPGVTICEGKIYVFGGCNGYDVIDSCECYDPVQNEWLPICPMKYPQDDFELVSFQSKIYSINKIQKILEIYDPKVDSWIDGPKLPSIKNLSMAFLVSY